MTHAAVRGTAWMIASGIAARIVGLLGTVLITRFVAPDVMGEVAMAMIIVLTAGWLTTWGFGQYAIVKGRGAEALEVTWHVTVAYTVIPFVGLGAVALLAATLAGLLDAPSAARYIPGLAAAAVISRIGATPMRVLTRSMRFRSVALASAMSEVVYAVVAASLAASGWGGDAVIVGNIARSSVSSALFIRAAGWREWATPVPLRWARFVDMIRFGMPLAVEGIAHSASRYWDTLVIARIFGPASAGVYNLAYNFADIPAVHVGEQVAGVLMPSMANLPPAQRAHEFERVTAMLALVLFPLAIGLGVVAEPLVALILPADWQGVAPLVLVLSSLSVFRPITWVLGAYLQARGETGRLMFLELANLILLLGGIWALSPFGLEWSAAAIGIAYGINAVAGVWIVSRNGLSVRRVALGFAQPLVACGAMAAGVLVARAMLEGAVPIWSQLAIEIAVGALVYVCVALVVCRAIARTLIELVRDLMSRRRAGNAHELAT